jgi:hypothetical protein
MQFFSPFAKIAPTVLLRERKDGAGKFEGNPWKLYEANIDCAGSRN